LKRILLLAFILCDIALSAQTRGTIFAPFVSELKAFVSDRKVELNWVDSQSVTGQVLIYRSTSPFSAVGEIGQEMLAEVYYGRQTYTDEVPFEGKWHYLIIATSGANENFEMVVPNKNIIDIVADGESREFAASSFSAPIKSAEEYTNRYKTNQMEPMLGANGNGAIPLPYSGVPQQAYYGAQPYYSGVPQQAYSGAPPSYAQPSYPVGTPPSVAPQAYSNTSAYSSYGISTPSSTLSLTGLSVYPEDNGIRINFLSGTPSKNVVLYRNIAPILRLGDLLASEVVQLPGVKSPVIDKVSPGIPCYYAVVYEEDVREGKAYIAPGYNSTLYPVILQNTIKTAPQNNPPAVLAPAASPSPAFSPSAQSSALSPQAAAALADTSLIKGAPYQDARSAPIVISEPKVFKQDLQDAVVGSDEYKLQSVVKDIFMWRNWNASIKEFSQIITSTRNPVVEARARFYLGQSYYFAGTVKAALTEFLAVQSRFPDESAVWIQASLNKLSNK
jgi:hypothetical protein